MLAERELRGTLGIGHTRWATHGPPTDANAHPHLDCAGVVAVVHNGTIENYEELVRGLEQRGHVRRSDTDTEVVAHLLEERYADGPTKGDLPASLRSICKDLEGSFVLVVSHRDEPDLVVAARRNLPLVIGLGDGENFVGSDVTAFIAHTREARAVEQDQVVELRRSGVVVTDLDGAVVDGESYHVDWDTDAAEKGGYDFFMLKEIDEQPEAIRDDARRAPDRGGAAAPRRARHERRGRPRHRAGRDHRLRLGLPLRHGRQVRHRALVPAARARRDGQSSSATATRCSAAARSSSPSASPARPPTRSRRVRHARAQKAWVLAVTNTVGSTISRESDAAFYTRSGPEVAVASTKAVITQITAMYLVGLYLAQLRGTRDPDEVRAHLRDLQEIPDLVAELLTRMDGVRALARDIADEQRVLFLGRHVGYPMALEGALKLKELAYVSAEGFPAGEIKHGPIALVEEGVAGHRHRAAPRPAGQAHQQRAGGPRPGRPHHRAGDRRRRQRDAVRLRTSCGSPTPSRCSRRC